MHDEEYPEGDKRSLGYHASQVALGTADLVLPGAGYALQQLSGKLIGDPLEKRRAEWHNNLARKLAELAQRIDTFEIETLAANEQFLDAVAVATEAAMKSHTEFRRQALTNMVLNTARGITLDEALRGRFLQLIDRFSQGHILVLRVLRSPREFPNAVKVAQETAYGGISDMILAALPRGAVSDDANRIILQDLSAEKLIDRDPTGTMIPGRSMLGKRTTKIGDAFLEFISAPV